MSHHFSASAHRGAVVLAAAGLMTAGIIATHAPSAHAASGFSPALTLTTVSPTAVAASTANVLVTLTGTNFDESEIASIALGGVCTALTGYIVASSTTILVKTTSACTASTAGAENVTINEVGAGTVTKALAITFITPPDILAVGSAPVVTDNSADSGGEVAALVAPGAATTGLEKIRVRAGLTYAFLSTMKATLGGKDLTAITLVAATTGVGSSTGNGNAFTAVLPLGLTTSGTLTLVLTQGGVSKSFATAATGLSWYLGPIVTGLDVTSGRAAGGTTVKITGTGLPATQTLATTAASWLINFCGVAAVATASSTTSITVTSPVVANLASGLGTGNYSGVCAVTVVQVGTPSLTSPVNANTHFVYLST